MSTQCPQCQLEIIIEPQNFGTLYSCPHCKGAFFVDWNGHPEVFQANLESESSPILAPEIVPEPVPELDSKLKEEPILNAFTEVPTEVQIEPFEVPIAQNESVKSLEDFSDVVNYSNASEATETVVYNLFISGLDSKKQIDIFTGAISDSKMGWIVEDILSQMSQGKIKLENLNAPKLHVLIQRLKFSGLDLRWEQKVLS